MDARSEANLAQVHPDLVAIMRATSQAVQPFIIIHGLRTPEEEAGMVAKGASETMHSRHLPNTEGFCCAVDVAAMTNGHADWSTGCYDVIWQQVQKAAATLNLLIEWGGSWTTLKDLGHFQLPWAQYP